MEVTAVVTSSELVFYRRDHKLLPSAKAKHKSQRLDPAVETASIGGDTTTYFARPEHNATPPHTDDTHPLETPNKEGVESTAETAPPLALVNSPALERVRDLDVAPSTAGKNAESGVGGTQAPHPHAHSPHPLAGGARSREDAAVLTPAPGLRESKLLCELTADKSFPRGETDVREREAAFRLEAIVGFAHRRGKANGGRFDCELASGQCIKLRAASASAARAWVTHFLRSSELHAEFDAVADSCAADLSSLAHYPTHPDFDHSHRDAGHSANRTPLSHPLVLSRAIPTPHTTRFAVPSSASLSASALSRFTRLLHARTCIIYLTIYRAALRRFSAP